ncbi:hypothetical protein GW915_00470 [bacterium]|nr:hypothetical protein [bacterium]
MLRKLGLGVLYVVLFSPAWIALLIGILWLRPQLIVNKPTLKWMDSKVLKLDLDWEHLEFEVRRVRPMMVQIQVNANGFCYENSSLGKACFEELQLTAQLEHGFFRLRGIEVESFVAKDREIALQVPLSAETSGTNEKLNIKNLIQNLFSIPSQLEFIEVKDIEIALNQFTFKQKDLVYNIEVHSMGLMEIQWKVQEPSQKLDLLGHFNLTKSGKTFVFGARGTLASFRFKTESNLSILSSDSAQLTGYADADFTSEKKTFSGHTQYKFFLSENELKVLLSGLRLTPPPEFLVKQIEIPECEISWNIENDGDSSIPFQCNSILVALNFQSAQIKSLSSKVGSHTNQIPQEISFKLNGQVPSHWITTSPESSPDPLFASVEAHPIEHPNLEFRFKASTEMSKESSNWKFATPEVDFEVTVQNFQKIVSLLRDGPYALPAPINSLEGTLSFKINQMGEMKEDQIKVPFEIKTNLVKGNNAIVTMGKGIFTLPRAPSKVDMKLDLDLVLEKLYIQLPGIDPIRGIPPLTQDSRIAKRKESKADSNRPDLVTKIHVQTANPDSIRIFHPFIEPYAAFSLDLDSEGSSSPPTLDLKKAPLDFKMNYLRRTLEMTKLELVQRPPKQKELFLEGQLLYQATDYKIFIDFSGPADRPSVVLTSEPPLDRKDIISVLLYNRVSSEISSFEGESVGGTEAALTDRAVGLLGLWAFASTPIESVAYDSSTKTYSAQIKLPEGFRFSVGTDWESVQNLELRRHLGGLWMVRTIYHPQAQDNQGRGEILLQRKKSY